MWLPTPVYRSLPTVYGVIGVFFILGVLYLGLDAPMGPVYLGLGIVSILASIMVTMRRSKSSSNGHNSRSDDSPTS